MFKTLFSSKKRRRSHPSSLFHKKQKTAITYKKRNNFSIKLDPKFFKKMLYFYYLLGAFIFGSLIYFFVFSQYFLVQHIKIQRQDNNSNIEIAYSVLDEFEKKNIFMLNVADMKKMLLDSQENLGNATIKKQFPKTITVNLISYKPLYNVSLKSKPYLMLANGSVVPGEDESLLPLHIIFPSFPNFYEYKKIINTEELKTIYGIEKLIKENFLSSEVSKINYYITEKEAHVIIKNGPSIIFNLVNSPKSQIEKLAVFHEENIPIDSSSIIYVDLRIRNKLYYCDTKEEYNCYNTLNYIYGKER